MYDSQCIFCYSDLLPNGECPICKVRHNQSKRGRAYKRHHRKRIIAKRQNIYFNIWNNSKLDYFCSRDKEGEYLENQYSKHPGRLAKHNLSCNCHMCKYEKHYDIPKIKDLKENLEYKEQLERI
jgi:hypothetical protein